MPAVPRTTARLLAATLTGAVLVLAGCSSSGTSTKTSTASERSSSLSGVTLKVGQTGYPQLQVALQAAGLDKTPYQVKYNVFTGGDKQLQALQAGALDVANASEIPPVFAAANTKPKWKAVITQQASTLLQEIDVPQGSKLASVAGLKGKKVGYVQNTTAQYFLLKLLQRNGLQWKDITPVPLLPNDGVAALRGGSIAAFATYGNSVITIKQSGGHELASGADILSGNFVYLAANSTLADGAKRAATTDLLARANKAYDEIRTDPAKAKAYAQKVAAATHEPLSQAETQFAQQEQQHKTRFVPAGQAAISSEQTVADAFTSLGTVGKVDVASFWTTALNADFAAALAKYPVSGGTAGLAALAAR